MPKDLDCRIIVLFAHELRAASKALAKAYEALDKKESDPEQGRLIQDAMHLSRVALYDIHDPKYKGMTVIDPESVDTIAAELDEQKGKDVEAQDERE